MKNRSRLLVLAIAAAAVLGGALAWHRLSSPIGKVKRVVLISLDTTRPDYLSAYGYSRPTSPNLDALAREGVLFTNVRSHVPITLPSHCSMLTGTLPPRHGVHDATGYKLPDTSVTLAEVMKEHGFSTAAFIGAFVLNSQFGLNQGFDSYDDLTPAATGGDPMESERRGEEVSRAAVAWLDKHHAEPFFLFVHYYDPHFAYAPPEPFAAAFADKPYAGEIAYADHAVGEVIAKLKSLGIYDSTLIAVTGDHGEGLGEHGEDLHTYFTYESTLRVPLVVKVPGSKTPRRVEAPVGLIDVMPTVLAAAGLPRPEPVQGRSLTPELVGGKRPEGTMPPHYFESWQPAKFQMSPLRGVIADGWKYIHAVKPELYDLGQDPGETRNLAAEHSDKVQAMRQSLQKLLAEQGGPGAAGSSAPVDPETVARINALGYVAGTTAVASAEFEPKGEDPKDFAPYYSAFLRARALFFRGEFARSRETAEELVSARPGFYEAHDVLGQIALAEGRTEEAIEHFNRHIAGIEGGEAGASGPRPEAAAAHERLGTLLSRANRVEEATTHFQALVKLRPDDPSARGILAAALMWQGKVKEAVEHWREVVRIRPDRPESQNSLAEALLQTGDLSGAIEHWQEAIRLAPEAAPVQLNLGSALLRMGRPDEAIGHFTEALRLKPDWPKAQRLLGQAYFDHGQFDKAFATWDDALRRRPDELGLLEAVAWGLATCRETARRDPARAVSLAEKAKGASRSPGAEIHETLAAAYAAAGRSAAAVKAIDQAIELLVASGRANRADEARRERALYQAGKPYVAPVATPTPPATAPGATATPTP